MYCMQTGIRLILCVLQKDLKNIKIKPNTDANVQRLVKYNIE